MQARVTAVLVASNGAEHLPRTLEAIAAQTRAPDALVVVDCASSDATSSLLSAAQPTRFISASARLSFGTAVQHALGVAPPPTDANEWLWLLAHDTAPEPDALAALLAAVEVNPSVAAAGPKQMEWDDPAYIAEFGETVTSLGASVPLVETELDQAQHDRMSDVLGMAAAGLLVRHTVWNEVGGFDPALPTADNALDFAIRVRLAGHRVMAVPAARVATDGDGFSGPGRSTRGSLRRKRQTARRAAQLHRRLVYAPPFAVLFHWLSLVPLAVGRSLFQLVRKQPGAIGGEFAAAFKTAFGSRIGEARGRLKASRKVGWGAIAPLRMPGDEIRRRRSLQREIALTYLRGERDRIQFISSGGVATVLVVALVGFVVFLPMFGAAAVTGGGALPLATSVSGLWAQIGVGFRDIGLGFVGAADPFTAVLAVLGSITFWSPSFALVCLYLVALPLAALAAWFCAARLTDRPLLRTVAAVLWVLAPPFLGALDAGQVGGIVAHLLLPWLVLAVLAAPKSWSASAIGSILFAAVLAAAPSLWPALVLLWLAATILSRRNVARLIGLPIPALALFLPLIWDQLQRGTPLALLADPGLPVWRELVAPLDLLLGLPTTGLAGWQSLAGSVGIDSSVVLIVLVILTVPLGLLALASLVLPGSYRAVAAVAVALLGFVTALGATQLALATSGSQAVAIWPGAGLSLYWLGLSGAAVLGLAALPRFSSAPALVASVAVGVLVLPLGLGVLLGTAEVVPGSGRQLPAYVSAEASNSPRVGTLLLAPQADGSLGAEVVHGAGPTLDQQSTLASTVDYAATRAGADAAAGALGSAGVPGSIGPDAAVRSELATLVGNAASISGSEVSGRLTELGVEFLLLEPATTVQSGAGADDIAARTTNALNSNPQFTYIGSTFAGELWQVSGDGTLAQLPAPVPGNTGTPTGVLVLVIQAFVFGIALLLALPAGRLQVQGNRAVSATAHVAAADSAEERLAEGKTDEFDDDEPVGERPDALEEPDDPESPQQRAAEQAAALAGATAAATRTPLVEDLPPAPPSAALAAAVAAAHHHDGDAEAAAEPPHAAETDSAPVADPEHSPESPRAAEPVADPEPVSEASQTTGEVAAEPVETPAGVYAAEYLDEPAASVEPATPAASIEPAPSAAPIERAPAAPIEPTPLAAPADPAPAPPAPAAPVEPAPPSAPAPVVQAPLDDYDPNDETVLSVRDALDRAAAEEAAAEHAARTAAERPATEAPATEDRAAEDRAAEEGDRDGR